MVRRLCTAAAADGIVNDLTRRFVRNLKSTPEEQLVAFKASCTDVWDMQVRARRAACGFDALYATAQAPRTQQQRPAQCVTRSTRT